MSDSGTLSTGVRFQPTRPLRGATLLALRWYESDVISTHAPLAGRDLSPPRLANRRWDFNPRAPCGARHFWRAVIPGTFDFNPRAPCGARPGGSCGWMRRTQNFNPRAPCGARPCCPPCGRSRPGFQPTRPLRGATVHVRLTHGRSFLFQPTRPLRGATQGFIIDTAEDCNFNPRAPCGARHKVAKSTKAKKDFNPRAPCGARQVANMLKPEDITKISTHAPLAGRDTLRAARNIISARFQPTRPLRGATIAREVMA